MNKTKVIEALQARGFAWNEDYDAYTMTINGIIISVDVWDECLHTFTWDSENDIETRDWHKDIDALMLQVNTIANH